MSTIKREAIRDAHEYALAKMFYGEGAGVRRRLINQTVQFKIANIPGYDVAFQQELAKQDFAKLSRKARHERRKIDALRSVNKNGSAIVRGDWRAMSFPIVVVAGTAIVMHQTGADKKALDFTKKEYRKAKLWVSTKHHDWKHRNDDNVHHINPDTPPAFGATGPIPGQR